MVPDSPVHEGIELVVVREHSLMTTTCRHGSMEWKSSLSVLLSLKKNVDVQRQFDSSEMDEL